MSDLLSQAERARHEGRFFVKSSVYEFVPAYDEPAPHLLSEPLNLKSIIHLIVGIQDLGISEIELSPADIDLILEYLPNLTRLQLHKCGISRNDLRRLTENLPGLVYLHLGHNDLGDIGVLKIHASENLRILHLNSNRVGPYGARYLASVLPNISLLNLRANHLGDNGLEMLASGFPHLNYLAVSANEIGDAGAVQLASRWPDLHSLDIQKNSVGDMGVAAIGAGLPNLKFLDISVNRVTTIEPLLPLIQRVPSFDEDIVLSESLVVGSSPALILRGNPISSPPPEIVGRGPKAVLNFFSERDAQGIDRLYEAKLVLVGDGRAGKTTLFRRLYQPDMPMPEESETTKGIDIYLQKLNLPNGRTFTLNVWDFGGQQIYHATHNFFLTKRSLYILVDDSAKDYNSASDIGFKYWLEAIEVLTESSPVILFQNKKGGRSKQLALSGIKSRFPNVGEVFDGDLSQPDSVVELRNAIEYQAQKLDHVGDEVPAKWVEIRARIAQLSLTHPVITEEEYLDLYTEIIEDDRLRARHLSGYLHDLGVFLHFQANPLLRKIIILRNDWATDAVFAIVNDEIVKTVGRGRFTEADCERIWKWPEYEERHVELRELMEQFELCYKIPSAVPDSWLVPQLLSPERPTELVDWELPSDLSRVYEYDFLPRGIVSRLIVRESRYVSNPDHAWTDGVLLVRRDSSLLAQIREDRREIELRARGPEAGELLATVSADLEELNDSYGDLREANRVHVWVPCTCGHCRATTRPQLYKLKDLVRRRNSPRAPQHINCEASWEDVSVLELLYGLPMDGIAFVDGSDHGVRVDKIEYAIFSSDQSSVDFKSDRRKVTFMTTDDSTSEIFRVEKQAIVDARGASGPIAAFIDVEGDYTQIVNQAGNPATFGEVYDELARLWTALNSGVSPDGSELRPPSGVSPMQAAADIGCIAAAAEEARKGDSSAVVAKLAGVGKWVLDAATKIGTSVAGKLIADALGAK